MTGTGPEVVSILGTRVSVFASTTDAGEFVRARILAHRPTFCAAVNPEKVYRSQRDPELKQALQSAHVSICDGVGVSLASVLLHRKRLPRCTGVDLFMKLASIAAAEGWPVFLLGASPQSNEAACSALLSTVPNLKIAGSHHGYFLDSARVVEAINDSGAELLFVAMGSPQQEVWISKHLFGLKATFCMGIGGSLDVLSGTVRRAPKPFQQTGTEWLFRLLAKPSRIRRQMALPLFASAVLWAMIRPRQADAGAP